MNSKKLNEGSTERGNSFSIHATILLYLGRCKIGYTKRSSIINTAGQGSLIIMHDSNIASSASRVAVAGGQISWLLHARSIESTVTEAGLNDPEISIRIASKYLAYLGRLKNWNQEAVIRSYNGGPGYLNTVAGKRDTPIYYAKFLKNLAIVKEKNNLS